MKLPGNPALAASFSVRETTSMIGTPFFQHPDFFTIVSISPESIEIRAVSSFVS
jgi:hypothetical protein